MIILKYIKRIDLLIKIYLRIVSDKLKMRKLIKSIVVSLSIFLLFIHCSPYTIRRNKDYCYSTDDKPNRNYSTKTTYFQSISSSNNILDESVSNANCTVKFIYYLSRHGTRHNGDKGIIEWNNVLPKIQQHISQFSNKTQLCQKDIEIIANWTLRMKPEDDKELVETGKREQEFIAKEMKKRFPEFFAQNSLLEDYEFRHTKTKRTRDSALAFLKGLFDSNQNINLTESPEKDTLLHFYKHCDKYRKVTEEQSGIEYDKFLKGPEIRKVKQRVIQRLALNNSIEYETLQLIYDNCVFEYGIYNDAPWCTVFQKEDIDILEYAEDIKYYWEDSYPHDITVEQTCELVKDIWQHLKNSKEGNGKRKIVGRWAHSATVNTLYTRLGLYKDKQQLLHNNYDQQKARKWRTTLHTPMSSSIAFVLLQCKDDFTVQTFHMEKLIKLDGICAEKDCKWSEIEEKFKPISDNCNFDEICKVSGKNSASIPKSFIKLITLMTLLSILLQMFF